MNVKNILPNKVRPGTLCICTHTYTRYLYRNWPTEKGNLKRSPSDG